MHILMVEDVTETQLWLEQIIKAAFPDALVDITATIQDSLTLLVQQHYDIALIDLCLPDGSGMEILSQIRQQSQQPATQCVVMSAMGDDQHVISALSKGADGYLMKEQSQTLLIHQLKQHMLGVPALSPSIARRLMSYFHSTQPLTLAEHSLTERETQVLVYISQGLRNVEVAKQLEIAESTVASHIKSIYHKLGISSRAEAACYATHLGLNFTTKNTKQPPK